MGEDGYLKEDGRILTEKSDKEKEKELLFSILKTKTELSQNIKNFEFAEEELIDYYTYQMKATQAKLDYLLKKAKKRGLVLEVQNPLQMKRYQA